MDPSAVSFKPGDIVTIEDIGPNDAYFPSSHLLKGEILVIEKVEEYLPNGHSKYISAYVSPLFPGYPNETYYFISVKFKHLF